MFNVANICFLIRLVILRRTNHILPKIHAIRCTIRLNIVFNVEPFCIYAVAASDFSNIA